MLNIIIRIYCVFRNLSLVYEFTGRKTFFLNKVGEKRNHFSGGCILKHNKLIFHFYGNMASTYFWEKYTDGISMHVGFSFLTKDFKQMFV